MLGNFSESIANSGPFSTIEVSSLSEGTCPPSPAQYRFASENPKVSLPFEDDLRSHVAPPDSITFLSPAFTTSDDDERFEDDARGIETRVSEPCSVHVNLHKTRARCSFGPFTTPQRSSRDSATKRPDKRETIFR